MKTVEKSLAVARITVCAARVHSVLQQHGIEFCRALAVCSFLLFTIRLHRPCVHNLTVRASANCVILCRKLIMTVLWICIELQMRSYNNHARMNDTQQKEICCRQVCFLGSSSHTHHLWKEPPGCLVEMTSYRLACYGRMSLWERILLLIL